MSRPPSSRRRPTSTSEGEIGRLGSGRASNCMAAFICAAFRISKLQPVEVCEISAGRAKRSALAVVAQWQSTALPRLRQRFDSSRPLPFPGRSDAAIVSNSARAAWPCVFPLWTSVHRAEIDRDRRHMDVGVAQTGQEHPPVELQCPHAARRTGAAALGTDASKVGLDSRSGRLSLSLREAERVRARIHGRANSAG